MSVGTNDIVKFLEEDAYEAYTSRADDRYAFQAYLPRPTLQETAEILERPVTLEELQLLVGEDGDRRICSGNGNTFQPVWWCAIGQYCGAGRTFSLWTPFASELRDRLSVSAALQALEGRIRTNGCFYLIRGEEGVELVAFSGSVVWYDTNTSSYRMPKGSQLVIARSAHPERHWGQPLSEVQPVLDRQRKDQENRDKVHNIMSGVMTPRR